MNAGEGVGPQGAALLVVILVGLPRLARCMRPEHDERARPEQLVVEPGVTDVEWFSGATLEVQTLQQFGFARESGVGADQQPGIRLGRRRCQFLVKTLR